MTTRTITARTITAYVRGVGAYAPPTRLTNAQLETMVETSDSWIITRTGISERRVVARDEATSDMALKASRAALSNAGLSPEQIGLVVVATATPDHAFPATAAWVQAALGCTRAAAFDVNAACAGFITALQVAEQFIKAGTHEHVLVVGADTMSRITNYKDRGTCILFGDGAGAFVLSRSSSGAGILESVTRSDGSHYQNLFVPGSGSHQGDDTCSHSHGKIRMNGQAIFAQAVRAMSEATREVLDRAGLTAAQVDWMVPHQANQRIIEAVAGALSFPLERVISTIRCYGNTSAGSVPQAMDAAVKDNRIRRGDTVVLTAFGGGLSWGSVLLRY